MLYYFATSPQWSCKGVNGKGCFVTKDVSHHHAQNKCDARVYLWHRDHCCCSIKTLLALSCHHDWQSLVCSEDRDFFSNVSSSAIRQSCSTNKNHRLARQVNVLLVFSDVTRNRLVRQLRQLDAHFLGCNRVKTVANNCPVTASGCKLTCGLSDLWSHLEHAVQRIWHCAQCGQQLMPSSVGTRSKCTRQSTRQQCSC